MADKGKELVTLFIVMVLIPAILVGLEHSLAIALSVFSALCILFVISLTLRDVKANLERKEALFMKNMTSEEQERYWYARFRM